MLIKELIAPNKTHQTFDKDKKIILENKTKQTNRKLLKVNKYETWATYIITGLVLVFFFLEQVSRAALLFSQSSLRQIQIQSQK